MCKERGDKKRRSKKKNKSIKTGKYTRELPNQSDRFGSD
jgi:hypothetical protein